MSTNTFSPHAQFQARLIWMTWGQSEEKMIEILSRILTNKEMAEKIIEELEQQET
jgi:hypothetical protein